eukprot:m.233994 g.233994  ORF g.233994 m.233994 type:complete len:314 (+) comp15251_c1_seq2:111-1052(+)
MSSAQGVVTAATGPYLEKGRTVKGEPVPAQFHFHWDNAIWAHVEPNDGDIVVASAYKSGTTWTQNIALKIMGQDIETNLNDVFPWIDMDPCDKIEKRLPFNTLEAKKEQLSQLPSSPRFLKTHLDLENLPFFDNVKYIYLSRNVKDVGCSIYSHYCSFTDMALELMNLPKPPSFEEFFTRWVQDGYPFWPYQAHVASWMQAKDKPNVLFVHYDKMKKDPRGEIARIATFLEQDLSDERLDEIVKATSFETMKAQQEVFEPPSAFFKQGKFINKGKSGAWKDQFTEAMITEHEQELQKLSPEVAKWLETGEMEE